MHACMHVCTYVCMYVCMHVCMYIRRIIHIYICIQKKKYTHIYVYIYNFLGQHRMSILTTTNFLGNIFDPRASAACCTALGLQRFESSLCNNTSLVASRARDSLKITPLSHLKYWLLVVIIPSVVV